MKTKNIRYIAELYPRIKPSDEVIERYRLAIEQLPPIVVARDGVLVDGYHRWQAHVREEIADIEAEDLGNLSDTEIFNESITRNAKHGHQLEIKDKQVLAGRLWGSMSHLDKEERLSRIGELLAVARRSVERWTKEERKAELDEKKEKAWDLWLDCKTQEEISGIIGGVHKDTVNEWFDGFPTNVANPSNPPKSRQHFDIWQFNAAKNDAGAQSYFGACPPQIIENLLWFYTEPKDGVVVDLFGGTGTTIEVAKAMGRRVWCSDIRGNHNNPTLPIHKHDITKGYPDKAPVADLIFLDPPYWKQAAGRYSSEKGEMAEMTLEEFYGAWSELIKACKKKLKKGGRIAFIVSPTEDKDAGNVVDHAFDMVPKNMTIERRIIVPYSTQQATGQQVNWARDKKRMLKLYRDLVILKS